MKKVLASIILILFVTVVSAQKTYILCGKLSRLPSLILDSKKNTKKNEKRHYYRNK